MKEVFTMSVDVHEPEQSPSFAPTPSHPKKNIWPSALPTFRPAMYEYYNPILAFSQQLMHTFALALDLPGSYFGDATKFPMAGVRILHYPPQEVSVAEDVGLGAHTDYDLFTLVCQGSVPALEVLNANGIWVPAPPKPNNFVVNIGDFLLRIKNNQFQSTVHRVVNMSGERRHSIPFTSRPIERRRWRLCLLAERRARYTRKLMQGSISIRGCWLRGISIRLISSRLSRWQWHRSVLMIRWKGM
jgi:isopenicillin N synthase-like dioxygenase